MLSHDAFGFFRLRIAGVVAELKRAAQKKRIGAGEHIQITVAAADREVVDVRVRGHVNQLTLGRCDLRIVKPRRSAKSRAVEENFLWQSENLLFAVEIADDKFATVL